MGKVLRDLTEGQEQRTGAASPTIPLDTANPTPPVVTLESLQAQILALTTALTAKTTRSVKVGLPKEGSKNALIASLLARPGGVTNEEAKAILNWPAISLKTQAANMGITVRFTKDGREKRYFAVTEETIKATAEREANAAAASALVDKAASELVGYEY